MNDKPVVRFDVENGIGVITIDNPPVNALGPGVTEGIIESLEKGEADPNVKAFVMIGAGRSFIAGADIRGFDKSRPAAEAAQLRPARRRARSPSSRPSTAMRSAAGWSTRWPATTGSPFPTPRSACPRC